MKKIYSWREKEREREREKKKVLEEIVLVIAGRLLASQGQKGHNFRHPGSPLHSIA